MSTTERISFFVAHGDPIVAAGLRAVLGDDPDFELAAGEASHDTAAMGARVDLVVADYALGMQWLQASAIRSGQMWRPRVMIVTTMGGEAEARAALCAGVSGYVMQGGAIEEIRQAALAAARGVRYIAPSVSQRLFDSLAHTALTAREGNVLDLIAMGLCNKAIAKSLDISVGTVKSHVSAILEKLCASSRTQAVSRAGARGLIPPAGAGPAVLPTHAERFVPMAARQLHAVHG